MIPTRNGEVYKALHHFPEAEGLLNLLRREKVIGGDNPDTLNTANNLAFVYQAMRKQRNTPKTGKLYNRALDGALGRSIQRQS